MNVIEAVNKSLFFLGAGASWDAKCKLSADMLVDLKKRISNKEDDTFNKPEKEAIKFLLSCLEYHSEWRTLETSDNFKFTPNIEELALLIRRIKNRENFLPYPITGNWADKLVALENEYQNINDSNKIAETLFESLELKIKCQLLPEWLEPQSLDFLNPLKNFFQAYPNDKFSLDIFSLNNDMVLETYFTEEQTRPWRGFVSGEWRGFNNETPDDFGRINLYKLHGSLDWVRLATGDFRENKDNLSQEDRDNIEIGHDPYVIFGQGTKTFSVEPFFSLIQKFKQKLKEKSYIFIIGYSFFDPYINNLLLDAIKASSKRLIVINPTFGPEKLRIDKELKYDDSGFFKLIYPDETSNLTLASYIEDIQKNSFYSELPEFNIKRMNAKAIEYLPIGTAKFLESYFNNKGETFLNLIAEYEKERIATEEPF